MENLKTLILSALQVEQKIERIAHPGNAKASGNPEPSATIIKKINKKRKKISINFHPLLF